MRSVKAQTKAPASLLFSNLSANGKHVAYVSGREAVLVPDAAVVTGSSPSVVKVQDKDSALIQQVRFLSPPEVPVELLAIASFRSLQLFSADGKKMLHSIPLDRPSEEERPYFQGIAACRSQVYAGSSTGDIYRVAVTGAGPAFGACVTDKEPSCAGVVDLAGGGDVLAISHAGDVTNPPAIVLTTVGADGAFSISAAFAEGGLCTSMRIRQNTLFAAYSTGHIRLFSLESRSLSAVIAAHARWINAIEVHPTKDLFATASEDTFIGLWRLEAGGAKVSHVQHIPAADCTLTGIAFAGGLERGTVAVTAYDVDAVMAWNVE